MPKLNYDKLYSGQLNHEKHNSGRTDIFHDFYFQNSELVAVTKNDTYITKI